MSKKLFIKTWGCQMNVYDSARMADVLAPQGYTETQAVEDADLIILNTCHIREKATEKLFSELGRLRKLKAGTGQEATLFAVAGCVAQAEGEAIIDRAPFVDIVFGPQTYHRLPDLVGEARRRRRSGQRRGVVDTDFPIEAKFDELPESRIGQGVTAFLSVQEGCDKFCTFCVVPYTRGAEFSRPVQAILDEARQLRDTGAREITLLGQNVNAYHGSGPDGRIWGLGELIAALAEIEGTDRLRYTTSHPRDMDQTLIEAHGAIDKLMPYLHLPIQSGSDRMLRAMNRKHSAADYLDIIEQLRKVRPDLALSSDFIVGFPGETDQDFADTLALVGKVGFASAYSFKYSPRPGTPAADLNDQVDEAVKAERLESLQCLLNAQQLGFNQSLVGRTLPVLFEKQGSRPGQLRGRSPYLQAVHVEAPTRLIGEIMPVRIDHGGPNGLRGTVVTRDDAPLPLEEVA